MPGAPVMLQADSGQGEVIIFGVTITDRKITAGGWKDFSSAPSVEEGGI